ncbi:Tim17/Tim22/Tim23/Pmp24 family protein, partial [Paraclostridium dentum]|uniref:Tim17/Tim22/Tim23/Pmp24 family protein n=1 Tax=Paraclostridium dentum TaxID=2662455 RepID=UPI0014748A8F
MKMPKTTVDGVFFPASVDLTVDLGDPFFNRVVNGFLKIGTVAVAKVAVEETYSVISKGSVSKHDFEHSLKAMCKEGAYWGSIAGVYVGMEYGVERVRGVKDWKNAMLGGALTGAVISAACSNKGDKIVTD